MPDQEEPLELSDAIGHLLDECRMVLPGIQALFGFQMIAVFNNGFAEKLSSGEQKLHIAAIVLVVGAIALVMAPAAIHRQAEPKSASDRFLRTSTRLLVAAMLPLAIAICIDVFVVGVIVWKDPAVPAVLAVVLLALLLALWFAYPPVYRRNRAAR